MVKGYSVHSKKEDGRCHDIAYADTLSSERIGESGREIGAIPHSTTKERVLSEAIYASPSTSLDVQFIADVVAEQALTIPKCVAIAKPLCVNPENVKDESCDPDFELSVDSADVQTQLIDPSPSCAPDVRSSTATPIHAIHKIVAQGDIPAHHEHSSSEISIGCVVDGRYEILSEISRGGYGIVYRARQIGIDRIVALKRLQSQSDASTVQRFLLETNIIKNLVHPNTIQLIDAGIDRNHLYLVMEYIDGASLYQIMRLHKSLGISRAVNITRQILKSINEAHQRGIVHRDLKPSNILIRHIIGERDFVKVLDFGIAKVQTSRSMRLTQEGRIMGTPQYLAPEAFYGDKSKPSVDLFAVALIFYEMLTGYPLLPSDLSKVVQLCGSDDEFELPKWIQKSPVGAFLRRALYKDPGKRFQSASEMLFVLQQIEGQIQATESSSLNPRHSCRSRFPALKLALVAFFVLANALWIAFFVIM